MLLIRKIPFRAHRKPPASNAPPVELLLVSASYDPVTGPTLVLVFNQPINISGLVANDISVDDGTTTGLKYIAGGAATLEDPQTLSVILTEVDSAEASDVRLNATAMNGIIAVSDSDEWAGVTDLLLPWP
jgi:hypothetical protein